MMFKYRMRDYADIGDDRERKKKFGVVFIFSDRRMKQRKKKNFEKKERRTIVKTALSF